MNQPLVSIIVPVYNTEKYLDCCLKSIEKQTYKNIEIIVVNDGSTDKSLQICINHKNKDKRIKLITQENQGLSAARNIGIKNSTGHYISFIDSDDYIDENFIYENILNLINEKCDISMCCFYSVFEDSEQYEIEHYFREKNKIKVYKRKTILSKLAKGKFQSFVCNKVFKKSFFDKNNFLTGKYFEDVFLMHSIFYECKKMCLINKPLYYYLQRKKSIAHEYSQNKVNDFFEALFSRQTFFEKHKETKLCAYNFFNIKTIFKNYKIGLKNLDFTKIQIILNFHFNKLSFPSKIIVFNLEINYFLKRCINYICRKLKIKI